VGFLNRHLAPLWLVWKARVKGAVTAAGRTGFHSGLLGLTQTGATCLNFTNSVTSLLTDLDQEKPLNGSELRIYHNNPMHMQKKKGFAGGAATHPGIPVCLFCVFLIIFMFLLMDNTHIFSQHIRRKKVISYHKEQIHTLLVFYLCCCLMAIIMGSLPRCLLQHTPPDCCQKYPHLLRGVKFKLIYIYIYIAGCKV